MNMLEKLFARRHSISRVKTQQAEALIGPVSVFARKGVPCPTAGMTESLRFRQVCFALAKLHFRLPCGADVCHGTHIFISPAGRFDERAAYSVHVSRGPFR